MEIWARAALGSAWMVYKRQKCRDVEYDWS